MAFRTTLRVEDGWVNLVENHADSGAQMIFAAISFTNTGGSPLLYSTHLEQPEFTHTMLRVGNSVALITRHFLVRADGGDTTIDFEVSALATMSE